MSGNDDDWADGFDRNKTEIMESLADVLTGGAGILTRISANQLIHCPNCGKPLLDNHASFTAIIVKQFPRMEVNKLLNGGELTRKQQKNLVGDILPVVNDGASLP